jgi:hypothetical protein
MGTWTILINTTSNHALVYSQSLWRQLRQATWDSPIQTTSVSHSDDGSQKGAPAQKGTPPKYSW